ncbi:MAG TPA: hypothetical protein VGN81_02425 [Pseudonocardiaceae bacterium]
MATGVASNLARSWAAPGYRYARSARREAVRSLARPTYSEALVRLVTLGALGATAGIVIVEVALTSENTGSNSKTIIAGLLIAAFLPCHLQHLWASAHARRPRRGALTFAVMAVIVAAGTPLVGYSWLLTWVQLLVSALIVLPRPWSWCVAGALVLACGPANIALGNPTPIVWVVLVLLERTGAVMVPTWFAGALHRLRAAQEELAAEAVARERAVIDAELADTVGVSLDQIAGHGTEIAALIEDGDPATEDELRALVGASRKTLAGARRMIREYQRVPLRVELESAAELLGASGIRTGLNLPAGELPEPVGDELTVALRSAVDRLLHDDAVRHCEISVVRANGNLALSLDADGARLASAEVAT